MNKVEYKQTNREAPYPRKKWKCDCGFLLGLIEGHNPDFNSDDYGAVVIPDGKCMKCKGEIFVNLDNIEDTRAFKR